MAYIHWPAPKGSAISFKFIGLHPSVCNNLHRFKESAPMGSAIYILIFAYIYFDKKKIVR